MSDETEKHCMCGCIYLETDCPLCNKVTDAMRIEELEAKLAKALGAMQGVRLLMFEDQHKDAFRLLESTIAALKGDKP